MPDFSPRNGHVFFLDGTDSRWPRGWYWQRGATIGPFITEAAALADFTRTRKRVTGAP